MQNSYEKLKGGKKERKDSSNIPLHKLKQKTDLYCQL